MNGNDPYVYSGTAVLKNKLDLRDQASLNETERQLAVQRIRQGVPPGEFDLRHLRAIHRHIFQDVYDWAGNLRTVEISKDGHQFQFRRFIEAGMADVHRRVVADRFLQGLDAATAGAIIGDVNYVHPFRDGNGRAQLQYLRQLADRAGHPVDLTKIRPEAWLDASRAAQRAN